MVLTDTKYYKEYVTEPWMKHFSHRYLLFNS